MKIRLTCLLVIALLFSAWETYAQNFTMSNSPIGVCSGNWLDQGGNGNYNNNSNLNQTLSSSTGQCLKISFISFDVDVAGDTLYAYDGTNNTFPLIGKYTGNTLPADIISTKGAVTFKFKSNGITNKAGWKASISCVTCSNTVAALPAAMASGNYAACGGNFTDPGGAGNYSTSQTCTTIIYPATAGNNISLNFSSFDLGTGDNLKIYNGPSTAYPLTGTYTGTTSPANVISTNGALTLVFTSDASNTAPGWDAAVSCVPVNTNCANCTGAAPSNDYCSNVNNLGILATPAACPNGAGAIKVVSGTTICATNETAYNVHPACSMSSPVADVWYKFDINAPILNVNITGLTTPQVALYTGTSYISLIQVGCAVGANGQLSNSFSGLSAGTYYLQISGADINDQCNFSLSLQNNNECAACMVQSTLTANPLPDDGAYSAGQTVNFCYTITNFVSQSGNSLHGVVPTFGNGWDVSTFTSVSVPTSCSGGTATWDWYGNTITSSATGFTGGPGWFYETKVGNVSNIKDTNPGNNFGDNNTGLCQWKFCWSMKVKDSTVCVQDRSLDISVKTYSDGQTGSLNTPGCATDKPYSFKSHLACCDSATIAVTNTTCALSQDGKATATGHGVSPYTFNWKNANGATILLETNINSASTITNLAAGDYSLLVTDNSGCAKVSIFTINDGPPVAVSVNASSSAICSGKSTILNASGTASYSWSASDGSSIPSNASVSVSPTVTSTYTVTGSDAPGCSAKDSIVITVNSSPILSANVTQPACGNADGAIDITVIGNSAPYNYIWNTNETTEDLNNLNGDSYIITVTGANGCSATNSSAIVSKPKPTVSVTHTDVTCAGLGSVALTLNNGTAPCTYLWDNNATTQNISNLNAGNYNVTVTDNNGCTVSGSAFVDNTIQLPVVSIQAGNASCNQSNGSVTLSVTSGTAPYSFAWDNGATKQNLAGVATGTYLLTITDAASCTLTQTVNVGSDNGPSLSETHTQPGCGQSDGRIDITVNGGKSPFIYKWSDNSTNSSLTNISASIYSVTVTDANSCSAFTTVPLTSCALSGCNMTVKDSLQKIICPGICNGGIYLTINSGQPPYTFNWSDGTTTQNRQNLCPGIYKVSVQDANGCGDTSVHFLQIPAGAQVQVERTDIMCNAMKTGSLKANITGGNNPFTYWWSTGATTQAINNLSAGIYNLALKDAKGCNYGAKDTIKEPDPILVFNSSINEQCNKSNGSATLNVTGGVTPYTFAWSNGATTQNISGIAAGTYSVTVKDNNSCSAITSVTINNITPQPVFTPSSVKICRGSADSLKVGGANTYVWSPAINISSTTGRAVLVSPVVSTTYTVVGTDQDGCTTSLNIPVKVYNAPTIVLTPDHPSTCTGGITTLGVSGAATYQWVDNNITYNGTAGSITISPKQTMVYKVKGTDGFGCTGYDSVLVIVNTLPDVTASANDSLVCTGSSVLLNATTSNTGSVMYKWFASGDVVGSTKQVTAKPSANTSYLVTLTDVNGCTASDYVEVAAKAAPVINFFATDTILCGGGNVTLTYSGADSYTWNGSPTFVSSGNASAVADPDETTTYILNGKDNASGCITTKQITVQVRNLPIVSIINTNLNACLGADLVLNAAGADKYLWSASNAISTSTGATVRVSVFQPTKFLVTGEDSYGCTNQDTATVNVFSRPIASFVSPVLKGCAPLNLLFTNSSVNAVKYNWMVNNEIISNDTDLRHIFDAGNHHVELVAIGEGGCADTTYADSAVQALTAPRAFFKTIPEMNVPVPIASASFSFSNMSAGATHYTWNFGDNTLSDIMMPTHKYNNAGIYTVTLVAMNANGCADTLKKSYITVLEQENIFIPNTFTPNGDGENDVFRVYGSGARKISYSILDRSGAEVFHTDSNAPWDGKFNGRPLNTGVYICSVIIEYFTGKRELRQGDITLLR